MKKTIYILFILSMTLLASCHSSRNATKKTGKDAVEVERVSQGKTSKGKKTDNDTKVAKAVIKEANKWLGVPYRYGGTSRKGTDCSGLMMTIFEDAANVKLPRDSRSQQSYCRKIDAANLQPGDLVFFSSKAGGSTVSHVGLYVGDNSIIHASTSRGVIVSGLDEKYYKNHYHSSGRVEAITYAATGGKPAKVNEETVKVEEPQLAYVEPVKSESVKTATKQKKEKKEKSDKKKKEKSSKQKVEKPIEKQVEKVEIASTNSDAEIASPVVKVNGKITVQPKPRTVAAATTEQPVERPLERITPTEQPDTTNTIISGWMD